MESKFKVLRAGITQRDGEKFKKIKRGDIINLSPSSAAYFLSTSPPFVEDASASRDSFVDSVKKTSFAEKVVPLKKPVSVVRDSKKEEASE